MMELVPLPHSRQLNERRKASRLFCGGIAEVNTLGVSCWQRAGARGCQ